MIDLHCHLLPGIDDGAPDLQASLAMARTAVADGIAHVSCTPHIYPGLYENTAAGIAAGVDALRTHLAEAGIELTIGAGADIHLVPGLVEGLRDGTLPTLSGSRYLLLEPSHHVAPPGFEASVLALGAAGYVPLITHPERLAWIGDHYASFRRLANAGVWMQVTAGSVTGQFGRQARYWAERMLDEGLVHVLATDAHGVNRRPLRLAEGAAAAERWVGREEARRLVEARPAQILADRDPDSVSAPPGIGRPRRRRWLGIF